MRMEGKIFPYFCHNLYDMINNVMSIGQTNLITCQKLLGFFLRCSYVSLILVKITQPMCYLPIIPSQSKSGAWFSSHFSPAHPYAFHPPERDWGVRGGGNSTG